MTYFGGQDNFIFKIVLLDGLRCRIFHESPEIFRLLTVFEEKFIEINRYNAKGKLLFVVVEALSGFPSEFVLLDEVF